MYTACVFQTLRHNDLEIYLPDDIAIPWGRRHLNVALPLWKWFSDETNMEEAVTRETFKDALFSPDPLVRQWAEGLRDSFRAIRSSPDRLQRGYWRMLIRKRFVKIGHAAI